MADPGVQKANMVAAGLSGDAADVMLGLARAFVLEDLKRWNEDISYQGFNPVVIINAIVKTGLAEGLDGVEPKDKPTIMADVTKLVTVYLSRGTVITKFKNKTKAASWQALSDLLTRYKIKATTKTGAEAGASAKAPEVVTLSRLANAFGFLTARIAAYSWIQIIGQPVPALPKAYHWAGAAALIPQHSDYNSVYDAWVLWAKSFDRAINFEQVSTVTDEQREANVKKFGDIMRRNAFFTEESRVQMYAWAKTVNNKNDDFIAANPLVIKGAQGFGR